MFNSLLWYQHKLSNDALFCDWNNFMNRQLFPQHHKSCVWSMSLTYFDFSFILWQKLCILLLAWHWDSFIIIFNYNFEVFNENERTNERSLQKLIDCYSSSLSLIHQQTQLELLSLASASHTSKSFPFFRTKANKYSSYWKKKLF